MTSPGTDTSFSGQQNPTKRFSNRVENYVRYRPGYPREIIPLLQRECGLTNHSVVADIGSGTGFLAELFLENCNRVFGVEPNLEMREAGERLLERYGSTVIPSPLKGERVRVRGENANGDSPISSSSFTQQTLTPALSLSERERENHPSALFTSVDGTAEATTLTDKSVDIVVAGQAFHWFDRKRCRTEFARILRPQGWVVLIWNDRHTDTTPFLAGYERLLLQFATDYKVVNHKRIDTAVLQEFFGVKPSCAIFANSQHFDFAGLKGRLLSSSYAPAPDQPKHEEMLVALMNIFETHQQNGRVTFEYDTAVYYARSSEQQFNLPSSRRDK